MVSTSSLLRPAPLGALAIACCAVAPLTAQYFEPVPSGVPPRFIDNLVYDSANDMVVGLHEHGTWVHVNNTWRKFPTTKRPGPRYEYGMAFDGQRTLVYGGGTHSGHPLKVWPDFWAFNGSDWSQIPLTGQNPGPRRGQAMAYDPVRKVVVLFGGWDGNSAHGDTWEYNGTSWSLRATGGPSARVWQSMTYDPGSKRMILHGGANNPVIYDDTWAWDGSSWTMIANGPRVVQTGLVYDRVRKQVFMMGGWLAQGGAMGRVYALDQTVSQWVEITPKKRAQLDQIIGLAYDSKRHRTVIHSADLRTTWGYYFYGTGPGTYQPSGSGCSLSRGRPAPTLAALGQLPTRGSDFVARVRGAGTANQAVFLTGASNTTWAGGNLPFDLTPAGLPGCMLNVSPDLFIGGIPVQGGVADLHMTIPTAPYSVGAKFYQQAIVLDPTVAGGVAGLTNGAAAEIR